jgi:uncharacterized protein (TIGR00255 family)
MALSSMTGFGRGEAAARGMKIEVELGSVNRKQFDARLNLPNALFAYESQAVALIHAMIARGYVRGTVKVNASAAIRRRRVRVDADLAAAEVDLLRRTAKRLKLKDDLGARALTALPNVLCYEERAEEREPMWELVELALRRALRKLTAMRRREGRALAKALRADLRRAEGIVTAVRKRAPFAVARLTEALQARLREAGVRISAGDDALVREIALLADKADIAEELVRLDSHLREMRRLLGAREPVGRTLDFLCQEMFREMNTIGSKAGDAQIGRNVIRFKAVLEVIREQVQNVE